MTNKHAHFLVAIAAGFAVAADSVKAEGHTPSYSGDVTVRYDDNITRAQYSDSIEEDVVFSALGQIDYLQQLNETSGLIFSASAEGEKFGEFDELDNINIKGAVSYKLHLGYGFFSPRLSLNAAYHLRDYVNEQRSGNGYHLGAEITRRFSEPLTVSAGVRLRSFEADSDVFSVDDSSLFVNVDLLLNERLALYSTLRLITGDVVSTAEPSLKIINASDAIEPDDAFGGFASNRFVYRLDADTTTIVLGGNYALSSKSSVDMSLLYIDSQATDGIYYERIQYRASYLQRF